MRKPAVIESIESLDGGRRIEFDLRLGEDVERIYFASPSTKLVPTAEALVAGVLIPAMGRCSSIQLDAAVSPRFHNSLQPIMDIYASWWPDELQKIGCDGLTTTPPASPGGKRGVGGFFSAGVDSFHTLLKHQDEITDLILIHGFDYQPDREKVRQQVTDAVHAVARDMQKNVIEIETNLGKFLRTRSRWALTYGAMLGAVGNLLSGALKQIYIPAAVSYAELRPSSVHPLLGPLWSTEVLEFIHDGAEATRLEKVEVLANEPLAMEYLRVCWFSPNSVYNCGECPKCVRTMLGLTVCGALERCRTFPTGLSRRQVAWVRIKDYHRCFFEDLLNAMVARGVAPELQGPLRKAIDRPGWVWEWQQELRHPKRMFRNACRRLLRPFTRSPRKER